MFWYKLFQGGRLVGTFVPLTISVFIHQLKGNFPDAQGEGTEATKDSTSFQD